MFGRYRESRRRWVLWRRTHWALEPGVVETNPTGRARTCGNEPNGESPDLWKRTQSGAVTAVGKNKPNPAGARLVKTNPIGAPLSGRAGKLREFLRHALVHRPLERHHQLGEVGERLPAPLREFRLVAAGRVRDVDLALVAGEAQRVPSLRLSAILALPGLADDVARNVVGEPLLDRAEPLDRADVGLLVKLAQRRRPRILAAIDPALRHLPHMRFVDVLRPFKAATDEDAAVAIEDGHSHARTIGKRFESGHRMTDVGGNGCSREDRTDRGRRQALVRPAYRLFSVVC